MDSADVTWGGEAIQEHERTADLSETPVPKYAEESVAVVLKSAHSVCSARSASHRYSH